MIRRVAWYLMFLGSLATLGWAATALYWWNANVGIDGRAEARAGATLILLFGSPFVVGLAALSYFTLEAENTRLQSHAGRVVVIFAIAETLLVLFGLHVF